MKNHLTDQQIQDIRNKVDDNLFTQAYYTDDEAFNALFGKKKKAAPATAATDPPKEKKKINLGNLIDKGKNLVGKVNSVLQGDQKVYSGEYEGIKYEASVEPSKEDSGKSSDDTSGPQQSKTILGMPPPVAITGGIVLAIILIFIILKIVKK